MVGFLEQFSPVHIQAVQPWRLACRLECVCVVSGMLALHRREARKLQVRQVATKVGIDGILSRHDYTVGSSKSS